MSGTRLQSGELYSPIERPVLQARRIAVGCFVPRHGNGAVDADPTVQTCCDADRLDFGRVGIKPAARYLSPAAAQHIESAYSWSRQPKGLIGDEQGYELSPPGKNKQFIEHAQGNNE